ncbi:hypothetical protein [Brevundimonas sp.]|uniref:hypothetical protein n=1 Tax=Brevundimonas sp. TaxID=1871086 RepID=UPI002EDAF6EE
MALASPWFYYRRMTLFRPLTLLLLGSLAACEQPAPMRTETSGVATSPPPARPVEAERKAEPEAPDPAARVATLRGAWRVAGIDGVGLDEPIGLALTGDGRQLWWEPRCAGAARAYRIDGSRVSFTSTHGPTPAGAPTPPVCAIGLPPRLGDVMRALDEATSIARTESNGVLIAGPRHSVTLYSQ